MYKLICVLFICLWTTVAYPYDYVVRARIISSAESILGIREATGHNDGLKIKEFLNYVGLSEGNPWCSAVLCFLYGQNSASNPCSGLATSWFKKGKIVYDRRYPKETKPIHQADVFGLYINEGVHHVGLVVKWDSNWVETYEGNTSDTNYGEKTREGDGFYKKKRLRSQIFQVANWIDLES